MPTVRIPLKKPVPRQQVYKHLEAAQSTSTTRIPLPRPARPLHVYRHLLRATTYFPLVCRTYLEGRVKSGFRREQARARTAETHLASTRSREAREEENFHRTKALEEGKRKLSVLNTALAGDLVRFRRVLWHVFGRLGKRRRELMAAFVQKEPDAPLNSQQLEEKLAQMEKDSRKKAELLKLPPNKRVYDRTDPTPWVNQKLSPIEDNWDIAKLSKFFDSQKDIQKNLTASASWPRKELPHRYNPQANVPDKDQFGRPTPARRVTKLTRRWWKDVADRLMPPVDKSDWDLLQSIATGDAPRRLWGMPPRRPIALGERVEVNFPWAAHATIPVRDIEKPRSRKFTWLSGKKDDGPFSQTVSKERHGSPYSDRQLRREFLKMWETSSYVAQPQAAAAKGKPNNFIWGTREAVLPVPSAAQQLIFEGVDAKGQLPRAK
ncbi:hypothetical protein CkaCkLH20_02128 [Colletotrichum karsti]|uniref:Uncharacterized protein n=1 Tax=Colletotrichum karsti TaxID=1095194 RepID=A0A9P6IC90_9PEZI|nr:uncharacterized protein CkaCkLH20_02128 [Colletotrichum karsti]KAF9880174.1 hypothetical protein CkaCkLH20_02128 [Colletotrichum karsti]